MKIKTAADFRKEAEDGVAALSTETKKKFWQAMTKEGKNLGEAREVAGIDDVMVAAELVVQLHKPYYLPMSVDEIE